MKIQINGHEVDYLFNQDEPLKDISLQDIVESMMDWSAKRRLVLYSCFADEIEFSPEDIPDMSAEDIKILRFDVKSQIEVISTSFSEIDIYCNKLIKLPEEQDDELSNALLMDIKGGLEWIVEILHAAAVVTALDLDKPLHKTLSLSDFILKIENYMDKYSPENKSGALTDIVEIAYETKEILTSLMLSNEMNDLLIKSIDSPDVLLSRLIEIKNTFQYESDNIEQIAVLLQSGKDAEAIQKLNEFIEFVYIFIRVCAQFLPVFDISLKDIIKDDVSLEEKNIYLQEKLSEIVSVMENNDMIGLADILEYEIRPAIEDMKSYTDILIAKIGKTH